MLLHTGSGIRWCKSFANGTQNIFEVTYKRASDLSYHPHPIIRNPHQPSTHQTCNSPRALLSSLSSLSWLRSPQPLPNPTTSLPVPTASPPSPPPVPPTPGPTCAAGRYLCCDALADADNADVVASFDANGEVVPADPAGQVGLTCTAPIDNTACVNPTAACCIGEDRFDGLATLGCAAYVAP
ncbi:hypothetical protein HGRIS_013657 [Hohenbuehelia grisea]|uniref:Hydrophobin n=1 Tax=Hohenbuehelia grisea TaxID=104357 RepID=A0ABR3IWC1_9AGAR